MIRLFAGATLIVLAACGGPSMTNGGSHEAGLSCASDQDCLPGLFCATEDPGGQCIKSCAPSRDETCYDIRYVCNFEGHCYFRCAVDSDCARASEGYVCKSDPQRPAIKFCDRP